MLHSLGGSIKTDRMEGRALRGRDGGWTVVLQPATDPLCWRVWCGAGLSGGGGPAHLGQVQARAPGVLLHPSSFNGSRHVRCAALPIFLAYVAACADSVGCVVWQTIDQIRRERTLFAGLLQQRDGWTDLAAAVFQVRPPPPTRCALIYNQMCVGGSSVGLNIIPSPASRAIQSRPCPIPNPYPLSIRLSPPCS